VRSSADAADTSGGNSWALVDTGSEYSFLVSADNWARWQCASHALRCCHRTSPTNVPSASVVCLAARWNGRRPTFVSRFWYPHEGHQHSRLCDILGIAPIAEHGLTVNDGAWSFYLE